MNENLCVTIAKRDVGLLLDVLAKAYQDVKQVESATPAPMNCVYQYKLAAIESLVYQLFDADF